MNTEELYEKLRKDNYFFTLGKVPSKLKATCEYILGLIEPEKFQTQDAIGAKYNVTTVTIRRYRQEIMLRLGYKPEDYLHGFRCQHCFFRLEYLNKRVCGTK